MELPYLLFPEGHALNRFGAPLRLHTTDDFFSDPHKSIDLLNLSLIGL